MRARSRCCSRWSTKPAAENVQAGRRLLVAGHEILRFDMAEFDSVGTEGAGSGERFVTFDPWAGVESGDKIKLDPANCEGDACDALGITIETANAP